MRSRPSLFHYNLYCIILTIALVIIRITNIFLASKYFFLLRPSTFDVQDKSLAEIVTTRPLAIYYPSVFRWAGHVHALIHGLQAMTRAIKPGFDSQLPAHNHHNTCSREPPLISAILSRFRSKSFSCFISFFRCCSASLRRCSMTFAPLTLDVHAKQSP